MLTEALDYTHRGWAIFPCRAGEKRPATRNGFKAATIGREAIEKWWTRQPDYNVGLATGEPSGLVAVDVDPRHGGDRTLAALVDEHGDLPETPTVETGGDGLHYLFAHPGGIVRSRSNALGRGVDVKADGAYIVAPPSRHPSGKLYRWIVSPDHTPAPLPEWMRSLLQSEKIDVIDVKDDCCASCISAALPVCVSMSLCHWVEESIRATLPEGAGRRNAAIFAYVRRLRAHPELATATPAELRAHALAWHKAAAPAMSGEHGPDDTWADFWYGWERVKYPHGAGPLAEALNRGDAAEPPACAAEYGEAARRLAGLCRELQRVAGDGPFYLAYRSTGDLLGIDRNRAGRLLGMLVADGVLNLISKGRTGRASEYRFVGDNSLDRAMTHVENTQHGKGHDE